MRPYSFFNDSELDGQIDLMHACGEDLTNVLYEKSLRLAGFPDARYKAVGWGQDKTCERVAPWID